MNSLILLRQPLNTTEVKLLKKIGINYRADLTLQLPEDGRIYLKISPGSVQIYCIALSEPLVTIRTHEFAWIKSQSVFIDEAGIEAARNLLNTPLEYSHSKPQTKAQDLLSVAASLVQKGATAVTSGFFKGASASVSSSLMTEIEQEGQGEYCAMF